MSNEILLVEDNKVMQLLMTKMLSSRGYHVITAINGIDALAQLETHTSIQLVLSDWMMPGMNGIELCYHLKSPNYGRYIFFVLLSGRDDEESIVEGINAGADDFVAKETNINELDARLKAGFRNLELHNQLFAKNIELDRAYATIRQDLDSANALIRRMLPSQTTFQGVELHYTHIPSAQIGGDMLGCMQLDEEHVAIYLFDVAGHGVASALMSFAIQQSISANSGTSSNVKCKKDTDPFYMLRDPSEVLSRLNQTYLSQDDNNLYFTMIYSVLNIRSGTLSYASAGHPPMIWLQKQQQRCQFIEQDSFVAGMFDFAHYQTEQVQLNQGDRIFFYSDGITEAESLDKQQYSELRLKQLVQELAPNPAKEQTETIVNTVKSWCGIEQFDDDISLLTFEWKGN
ncbi:response regulator receiver modulated serine phosphatase [Shewanella halifaxensis HAW-EB4]|uniref:Response regulator receiver modulated serine phosphatase n=1 Tax=Shewanella halifaxensis (strain HAW-EB4) TaxID=458817 RepID=B0TKE1_SHEHH|nr:fused response regulator/phosphatase [Shewanella halifaxensis]ABZ78527.1 response regulator receiver modulated serine phosphatase [Shewanella halifaxensis HAW-EB4]